MVEDGNATRVLIVGGGFAGVACAKRLAGEPVGQVTLVDRNGYHQFQPPQYQVATAELTATGVRFDLVDVFASHSNVDTVAVEVESVDPRGRRVTLTNGAELNAFQEWAEEFYVRPHHRSAELLDPSTIDTPRITWKRRT